MRHALAALVVLALPAAAAAQAPACPGQVTVEGRGVVVAVPDLLAVTFGVEAEADGPAAAFDEAGRRMRAVLEALEAGGVAARDVATSAISLGPVRERPDRDSPPETVGWRAGAALSVTVRDLAAFGPLADAAVAAGATGLGSARLEVSEPEAKLAEARDAAVRDALARAEAMAAAAGLRLGAVLSLVEAGASRPEPAPFRAMAMAESADAMPVAPGERELEARVTATVALCPAG